MWFVKVEESLGFDKALEIDKSVWEVLPKIQARLISSFIDNLEGIDLLLRALETKLELDHFKFELKKDKTDARISIIIKSCPWHNIMIKSGREKKSALIGKSICKTEYQTFASEFFDKVSVDSRDGICKAKSSCIIDIDLR